MQTQWVHIGGRDRPFRWGMNAARLMSKDHDCEFGEIEKVLAKLDDLDSSVKIMYYGLKAGALSEGEDADFNEYKVADWLEELDDHSEITKAIEASLPSETKKKAANGQGGKQKGGKKKSQQGGRTSSR